MGKTILVTGVAGLFGANFSRYLLSHGYRVIGIDDLSGGYREFLPESVNFVFLPCKISSVDLDELIQTYNIEYVYHFAAYAAAGLSPFIREFNFDNNIMESAKLINASIRNDINKFIWTSSMEVYGNHPGPFKEEDIDKYPTHTPYGIAKRAVELDLESAYQYHDLDYAIIRPHNVQGVYCNIWDRYRNVIGIFIRQAIAGEPLAIYGDGFQVRAFSDIDYYMEPLLNLMDTHSRRERDATNLPIWNIGADKPTKVLELAEIVNEISNEILGRRVQISFKEPRKEVKKAWCDHTKAKQELNFEDETDLEELVRKMFKWALNVGPKQVKKMSYEVDKKIYEYWK